MCSKIRIVKIISSIPENLNLKPLDFRHNLQCYLNSISLVCRFIFLTAYDEIEKEEMIDFI